MAISERVVNAYTPEALTLSSFADSIYDRTRRSRSTAQKLVVEELVQLMREFLIAVDFESPGKVGPNTG